MKKILSPKAEFIASMLIFSTLGFFRHGVLFSSSLLVFFRALIGSAFLALLFALGRSHFAWEAVKKHKKRLAIAGAITALDWILLFEAYKYTTVAIATMCYCMSSLIFLLASPFLFGEKITRRRGIAAACAVFGMTFVSGMISGKLTGGFGIFLALMGACCYAAVMALGKDLSDIDGMSLACVEMGIASLAVLPYVLFTEDFSAIQIDLRSIVYTVILGVAHTGIAYSLWFSALQHLAAQSISLLSYIDPVSSVFVSAILLSEPLTPITAIGCVIVIGSMVYGELGDGKAKQTPAPASLSQGGTTAATVRKSVGVNSLQPSNEWRK